MTGDQEALRVDARIAAVYQAVFRGGYDDRLWYLKDVVYFNRLDLKYAERDARKLQKVARRERRRLQIASNEARAEAGWSLLHEMPQSSCERLGCLNQLAPSLCLSTLHMTLLALTHLVCCCKQQSWAAYAVAAQLGKAALRQARWPYPALDVADANLPALLREPCELEAAPAPDHVEARCARQQLGAALHEELLEAHRVVLLRQGQVDLGCALLQPAAALHEPKEPEGSEQEVVGASRSQGITLQADEVSRSADHGPDGSTPGHGAGPARATGPGMGPEAGAPQGACKGVRPPQTRHWGWAAWQKWLLGFDSPCPE